MKKFNEKLVVITGGTSGIGLSTAQAFLAAGAEVWITGRNAAKLDAAAQSLNSAKLKTVVSDTSTLEGIARLREAVAASGRSVDVLFLNAAIATFTAIAETTEADFDAQFNTNVKGAYFTLQQLLPHLTDAASVIFTSSTNATAAALGSSVYSATKGALNKIAQVAANELASRKIRVNVVSPGPTETPGLDYAVPNEAKGYLASITALQRLAQPTEIAQVVLFLASEDASFISGTEIIADGGLLNFATK